MAEQRFTADRTAYLRTNAWLAALAMAGAMALLWAMGNAHVWTGAVAGLAAIGVRGWYLASEELAAVWEVSDGALTGPGGRRVPLNQIETVRKMGSFVQVITCGGDKHLIKYQADPDATVAAIRKAAA
ncbi:hypothetical protein [Antarcticimicrobium luteum]|uniref:PH domain-containing protein n=1 Tax=Antarcticimicrobium luteum TaxID=2547397 RepID=A0A4R5UWU2_9RHOB|nr:hypothetical protein [Antarcticimicrobium luteum]TDK43770.1 hypothetical protein E1832_15950 [Antarcticimicrobium luteum]